MFCSRNTNGNIIFFSCNHSQTAKGVANDTHIAFAAQCIIKFMQTKGYNCFDRFHDLALRDFQNQRCKQLTDYFYFHSDAVALWLYMFLSIYICMSRRHLATSFSQ